VAGKHSTIRPLSGAWCRSASCQPFERARSSKSNWAAFPGPVLHTLWSTIKKLLS